MTPETQIWPFSYNDLLKNFLNAPEVLQDCVNSYTTGEGKKMVQSIIQIVSQIKFSKVVFIGNTFNHFASFIPRFVFMNSPYALDFTWECIELTEFYDYFLPEDSQDTLYIFISRSGSSRLILKALDHLSLLKIDRNLLWLITNEQNSPVAKKCGQVFHTYVDSELVIGLKSFGNTLFVLYLVSQMLVGTDFNLDTIQKGSFELISELKDFRESWEKSVDQISDFLGYELQYLYFISKDPSSLACAKFAALIAKTYHRKFAEGIALGHFFHGPFQVFERRIEDKSINCMMLVGDREGEESNNTLIRLIDQIKIRAGKVVILCNNPSLSAFYKSDYDVLMINFNSPIIELSPIFETFILQLAFLKIAKKSGLIGK
ncbi:hypothetical protein NEF87_002494 [Candidatus Lokiarchaeum ossiferum]|uniref:SIS domain-containing protein n=1 Tax=Candidatus Lokiarchaeum ossiferum TaxID=2951803 RepID=A0ABY6HRT0_9ARCH|nr:hypothetical protein NEF87_002494 [Candidatus Lokiarchaeum sp. B-35]